MNRIQKQRFGMVLILLVTIILVCSLILYALRQILVFFIRRVTLQRVV